MLVEEAGELGAGIRPMWIGVGPLRGTPGPAMSALVDNPALGQGRLRGVLVARAGVSLPASNLPAGGHCGRLGGRTAARAARRQDMVDEGRGVGVVNGRIPVTMEDDQRPGMRRGPGRPGRA